MASNPDGSFTVTLADVYAEVRKTSEVVLTMAPQAGMLTDHESRLRTLERWKYTLPASLITSLAAVLVAILSGR